MNLSTKLLITSAALCTAFTASAGTKMSQPITNGGTGYIGLTDSVGQTVARVDTRTMGAAASAMAARNPSWGTPD